MAEAVMVGQGRASVGEQLPELFADDQWEKLAHCLSLPPRQQQIARLVCCGCSNRQIAARLAISRHTVRTHQRCLFERLDVHDRVGLVVRLVLANRAMSQSHRRTG